MDKEERARIYIRKETHSKIKAQAKREGMAMLDFIDKVVNEYREKK